MNGFVAALLVLFATAITSSFAQEYTHYPIRPIYDVDNDIRKGETALVLVYSAYCPRSQNTLPAMHEAAEQLMRYGIRVKSLEYYQTGFEYMKVINPLYHFPGIVMYRADGSKVKYYGVDAPSADASDFVRFALSNQYPY